MMKLQTAGYCGYALASRTSSVQKQESGPLPRSSTDQASLHDAITTREATLPGTIMEVDHMALKGLLCSEYQTGGHHSPAGVQSYRTSGTMMCSTIDDSAPGSGPVVPNLR